VHDPLLQLGLFAAALVANLLSALAGGGAGLVQLPVLILLGLPFPVALATHKVASVALGLGATLRHARERSLDPGLAAFVLACGLPGVVIGARLVLSLPPRLSTLLLGLLTVGLVRWFGLDYGRAVATTLVLVGLFWNGAGALTLALGGQVAWGWLPMLLLGSLTGGYLGAHLAIARGTRLVKRAFEVLALLMGASLLLRSG
jgi:hypothetical protein